MKKIILAILTLLAGLGIYGCSDDETTSDTLTAVNLEEPDTIVGTYSISSFILQEEDFILATNCNDSAISHLEQYGETEYTTDEEGNTVAVDRCNQVVSILGERVSIEKYDNMYAVVIQLQLYNNGMDEDATLRERAYRHLFFPIAESDFPEGWGPDAVTKATERGLESFIIARPYGDRTNTNSYIQRVAVETVTSELDGSENEVLVISFKTDEDNKTYIYKLLKTSDTPGNYVTLVNQNVPQAGVSAISNIFNSLIVSSSEAGSMIFEYFAELINE